MHFRLTARLGGLRQPLRHCSRGAAGKWLLPRGVQTNRSASSARLTLLCSVTALVAVHGASVVFQMTARMNHGSYRASASAAEHLVRWLRAAGAAQEGRESLPESSRCSDRSAVASARRWRGQPVTASWEDEQRAAPGPRAGYICEARQERADLDLAGTGSLRVT